MLTERVRAIVGNVKAPSSDESIAARLANKQGLLRRGLRGRNTDMAGRSVIVPDPTLDPEQVGLPEEMYRRLRIDKADPNHTSHDIVIINRQPTLHPYNVVALHAVSVVGHAIRLHPMLCATLAGDFDGDEVTVHRPASEEARRDACDRLLLSRRLRSTANGGLIVKLDLDVALGLYLEGMDPARRAAVEHLVGVSVGGEQLTPEITSRWLGAAVDASASQREALELLAKVFKIGCRTATGWSVSALGVPPGTAPSDVDSSSQLGLAMAAAVAGKPSGLEQMLRARGSLTGFDGRPTEPVGSGFVAGLSNQDYFSTAPCGLRALADKKLATPLAGNLTKILVEACYEVIIESEDCGREDPRSPFGCTVESSSLCARCFGLDPATGREVPINHRIGIWSAMVLGERSTQNAMKSFHAGGSGGAIGTNIELLQSAIGRRSFPPEDQLPEAVRGRLLAKSLKELIHLVEESPERLSEATTPVVDLIDEALGREVDRRHIEVVFRHFWRNFGRAVDAGDPLLNATIRGSLLPIVAATSDPARIWVTRSPARERVVESSGAGT